MKFLTGSTRSLGPRCSPETQQSREDKVSSSRPVMVRVLRMVVTAAADSRFSGIQLQDKHFYLIFESHIKVSVLVL